MEALVLLTTPQPLLAGAAVGVLDRQRVEDLRVRAGPKLALCLVAAVRHGLTAHTYSQLDTAKRLL